MIDPPLGMSGAAARDIPIRLYALMSSACLKTSRGVERNLPTAK
jgi:hypothetical protein